MKNKDDEYSPILNVSFDFEAATCVQFFREKFISWCYTNSNDFAGRG